MKRKQQPRIVEKQYVVMLSSTELATALVAAQRQMAELAARHLETLSEPERLQLYGLAQFTEKIERLIEQERMRGMRGISTS
ncbi:hypothetical protein EI42_05866 [Thermosporothrix hazakensis]|jgi:hypothetical protein|uniref:Uncharacterized protein n=1 Tax=Thermosporothrix hazakensis TaxID=644383 RepID=A0A326TUR1_THEHA|nr:hypothetical protein [Thermosporothrix hazakensis]PZW20720.1 hypothetical protein EI42_05866 [Thermosporothrix hazakensis]GCE49849.1 hypothetical protein KTH_47180 [Thermosporothrix hazakensis]